MSCFSCFSSKNKENESSSMHAPYKQPSSPKNQRERITGDAPSSNIEAETFTFRELATTTKNFRQESLIGEGGFGRVYKGKLEKTRQVVAVKQLDRNGLQGPKDFLVEVLFTSTCLLDPSKIISSKGLDWNNSERGGILTSMA